MHGSQDQVRDFFDGLLFQESPSTRYGAKAGKGPDACAVVLNLGRDLNLLTLFLKYWFYISG
jgi:hypothetical protein